MSLSALTSRLLASTANALATTDAGQNQKSGSTATSTTASTEASSEAAKGAALTKKTNSEIMADLITLSASKKTDGSEPLVYTAKQLLAQLRNNMVQSDPLLQNIGNTGTNTSATNLFDEGLNLASSTGSGGIAALISGALPDTAAGTKSQNAAVSKFLSNNPSLVDAYRQSLSGKGGFTTSS